MKIEKAKRLSVPLLISIAGVSGSGKTYSALLLAAGMGKRVGLLDTENGRGAMYADSPGIMAALPQGYEYAEIKAPFSPDAYSGAVDAFEKAGCDVLVIDSMTHEWEGYGGCTDIAENNKLNGMPNWALAKLKHKRMMNRLLASKMHVIFCLRAREKTVPVKNDKGKIEFQEMGLTAIQEKNFVFEMTLSMLLDEHTHLPQITKCPEPLRHLFDGQGLIAKGTGEKLRSWADGGAKDERPTEGTFDAAMRHAKRGTDAFNAHWTELTRAQRDEIRPRLEELKQATIDADDAPDDIALNVEPNPLLA